MDGVVGNQRDHGTVRPLGADQSELAVHRPIRIETETNLPVHVARAPVNIRHRSADADTQKRGFELASRFCHGAQQRRLDLLCVLAVPLVIATPLEEDLVYARWARFGRGVGMAYGPPELAS